MVAALPADSPAVVSVKMRAGFTDTALMRDNLLAAEAAGAAFLTLHPRTKVQGYQGCVLRRRVC
jgi:tRNA-dihydrouridine synthase C